MRSTRDVLPVIFFWGNQLLFPPKYRPEQFGWVQLHDSYWAMSKSSALRLQWIKYNTEPDVNTRRVIISLNCLSVSVRQKESEQERQNKITWVGLIHHWIMSSSPFLSSYLVFLSIIGLSEGQPMRARWNDPKRPSSSLNEWSWMRWDIRSLALSSANWDTRERERECDCVREGEERERGEREREREREREYSIV